MHVLVDACAVIRSQFDENDEIGDRRQEIVFIGLELKQTTLTEALDRCLLTTDELEQQQEWTSIVEQMTAAAIATVANQTDGEALAMAIEGLDLPARPFTEDDPFDVWPNGFE